MLVYVDQVTERLQYTFDFVFRQHGVAYEFTNDRSVFEQSAATKLNYSEYPFGGISQLSPSELLFDEFIDAKLKLEKTEWQECPCFSIDGKTDPFAAIFYLLSRYEEYVVQKRDRHDRFEATGSILYRFGWLQQQIVERLVEAIIRTFFPEALPDLEKGRSVTVIPSFDIDNTYAYKWKHGWRKWLAIAKDYSRKETARLHERKAVNSGIQTDPYDTYDRIAAIAKRFPDTRIFWLLGDYAEYDRNISWRDPRHQRLIRNMQQVARIGLHPSYASNLSDKRLTEEKQRISAITGKNITESRQHFLKVTFPVTYRRLIAEGFRKDYSLGYADQPGFRAGTAHPFFFFDLERNLYTDYKLIPFVYMDGTFNEYMHFSVEESCRVVDGLATELKRYGGVFCFIWHNETIAGNGIWAGWPALLDYTLTLFEHGSDETIPET
jgi:hypothetical protein